MEHMDAYGVDEYRLPLITITHFNEIIFESSPPKGVFTYSQDMDPANGWRSCSRNSMTWSRARQLEQAAAVDDEEPQKMMKSTWKVILGIFEELKNQIQIMDWIVEISPQIMDLEYSKHGLSTDFFWYCGPAVSDFGQECDELLSFAGRVRRDVVT